MTKVLFTNTVEPHCGVHQFGVNFCNNLRHLEFAYLYDEPRSLDDVQNFIYKENIKALIVNWHPDIGGWPTEIDKIKGVKKVLLYHDGEPNEKQWDAIMFADPTFIGRWNWFKTPRPIPASEFRVELSGPHFLSPYLPRIGSHGFYGASANLLVEQVAKEFAAAIIYLNVPVAHFGDSNGQLLLDVLKLCSETTDRFSGIKVIPDFRFHSMEELVRRLSLNDINCYFRPVEPEWRGVSSALDAAVASGRPLAINRCKGFRHMHGIKPSICIEDRTIRDIANSGTKSLMDYVAENTPEKLTEKVDDVMRRIL